MSDSLQPHRLHHTRFLCLSLSSLTSFLMYFPCSVCSRPLIFKYAKSKPSFREGNSTPLQDSCLENPMDGGAWWAAVCGVAQSRTRLKRLSSSSSSSLLSSSLLCTNSSLCMEYPSPRHMHGWATCCLHSWLKCYLLV